MLTWYKKAEAKTEIPNFTWFPNSFVFPYLNLNSLYSVHLFGTQWSFTINVFSNVLFRIFDCF